jgi:hypothetical protein
MEDDSLRSEHERANAELAAARRQHASLGARIAGLEAQAAALAKAIHATEGDGQTGLAAALKYRTDEIVEVLEISGAEMSIRDVMAALGTVGRPNETYDNVSADLAYLAERGRIDRPRRGVYRALTEPQPGNGRIIIRLTQGNLNNNHVYLSRHLAFFPADAIGGANKAAGTGRPLTLHFDGLSSTTDTDIDPNHKIFRARDGRWSEFFEHHNLKAGDRVVIEQTAPYHYRIGIAD